MLRRWIDEGRNPLPVSVNISRYDIFRVDFLDALTGLIEKYAIPAPMLRLEITESAFAQSTRMIVSIVQKLVDSGFIVEIDDFGSGYSSLNTLKSVPAQVVKLDMRFLEEDDVSGRGGNILESIVRMTKWLGMSVIAEGVEEREQADYLASVGCGYIQGYFYARPMSAADYEVYCENAGKEERLLSMESVANLNNNSFWDPKSMDTLIFNSYVGAACIFEYHNRQIELLRVNSKFTAILGDGTLNVEDTLKLDWLSCLAPQSLAQVRGILARSAKTGEEYTAEYEFLNITPAQPKMFLRSTMRVIATAGERMLVYCTSENITAQRRAERQMQEASEQLRTMMDDMPGGFVRVLVCPEGTIKPVYFNKGFEKLTGMSAEELMAIYGDDVTAGVYPDDIASVKKIAAEMLENGEAHSSRYRLRHGKDGYFWVSTFERITRDAAGKAYINIYFTDATRQVREEETQRALLDNLPGGAGLFEYKNGALSVAYLNKSYWKLVGREAGNYTSLPALSGVHPQDMPVLARELEDAMAKKCDLISDFRLRHETKGYRPVHLVGRIVPAENGNYSIYTTFTPISDETISYRQLLPLLLSAMMESTTDLAFSKGTDLRYITASRAFANMAGRESEAEIVGKTDYELFDKELADKFRRDDEALLAGGRSLIDMIEPIPSGDGTPRYSSTSKYILRDAFDKVVGIYGIGRDVTRTVRLDSQLSLVNDSIPGGLATYVCTAGDFSPEHIRITYFNDGFCRLFGYTREEYLNRASADPASMVFREDYKLLVDQWLALMEHDTPISCLYRAHVKDGGYKWISHRAVAGERGNGRVIINAILQDVTDQRELIERLRISEEENELAVVLAGSVVMRYMIEDKTLMISPAVAKAHGLPEMIDDVPGEPVRRGLISPASASAYIAFFEAIRGGSPAESVIYQQQYLGEWRWMEGKSTTIFSDDGRPVKAVISLIDVTERMEKETIYKKWQQSLAEKPAESYTLFRCNLNNDASFALSDGALLTFDFDGAGGNFNERARAYIARCVYAGDRERYAATVNSDVLLARYYRGNRFDTIEYRELLAGGEVRWLRLTIELVEKFNSSEIEAYLMYEDIDRDKRLELQTRRRAETDPLTGLINRATLEERFVQLGAARGELSAMFIIDLDGFKLVNDNFGHAVGDETLIEIGQKLHDTFGGNELVSRFGGDEFVIYMNNIAQMSVVHERATLICALLHKSFSLDVQLSASIGISICPKDGEDFETLYRKADTALYHVKGIGKDGYAFYAESMSEKPATEREEPPEEPEDASRRIAAPKRRMLIVEDNEINRDYLSSLFEDEFIIDTAAEGTAALTRLKRYGAGISVVLLDLLMPGLDGFAVLKRMRENVTMQAIPVIVVSGMDERETCLEAIREGAADFITKPVDAEILKLRVASAISKMENERLRAQNRYLALQNEETKRLAEARQHTEELSVALHAAERADIAKSQFLSSMSHEIRTPLNAVIGYNSIARSEISEAKTEAELRQANMRVMDCLTKSEVASRHLLTIINDVLDMSAIEYGKLKVDSSPFDFRSLITSLSVMFFSQARAKGVSFEVLFDRPTEEWFVGDQLRVNQILTNLLSNAVKFTPEGGDVTLGITQTAADEHTAAFRFVVADTGIGMTQEYLEHIWTPFEQAEASISRRFGGSGLGLSITKNLVELMNGDITVESSSGVGSCFTVELTFMRTEQPAKPVNHDFSGINALVADDDVSTCDYIKLLFDRCGASCMTFNSGAEAVKAFAAANERGKPFNVCLIDWRMPQMDGFATIAEIRRIAVKKLPIVVVTAYDFGEVAEQAEKLGINRFVSKPLFQSSLFDLLATISGQRAPDDNEKKPQYDFGGARVLLAEDNNMNMEVARHILLSAKLAVDSAWNGQEAIDIFKASRPGTYKAILMDVHMPEVDGYEATRVIRASDHPDAGTIPIIAMTADVFAEDIAEAHSAGMNDHIAKPIDVEGLYKLLASYMEEKKA